MLDILNTQSSLIFALVVLTWVALALLLLMVSQLHVRLQRLEQAAGTSTERSAPYSRLVGRSLQPFLSDHKADSNRRLLLLLSSTCRSCSQLLSDLAERPSGIVGRPSTQIACLVAWVDGATVPSTQLPNGVYALNNGASIASALEIGITPFALVLNGEGVITQALPVDSAATVGELLQQTSDTATTVDETKPKRPTRVATTYQLKETTA